MCVCVFASLALTVTAAHSAPTLTLRQRRLLRARGAAFAPPAAVAVDGQAGPQLPLHPLRHGRGQLLPGLLRHGRRRRGRASLGSRADAGAAGACARGPVPADTRVDAVAQRGRASAVVAKAVLVLASVCVGRLRLRLDWTET